MEFLLRPVVLFDQRPLRRIDALVLGFLRGLPEEQIGRDRGAEDGDDGGEIIGAPGQARNEDAGERLAPGNLGKGERRDIGEQAERQPFQHRDVAFVIEKYLRRHRRHAEQQHIDDAVAADQQFAGVRHGAEVGGDVDGVGDEQQRHHHVEQPRRIMPAHIARYAMAGDAADARGDFLDRRPSAETSAAWSSRCRSRAARRPGCRCRSPTDRRRTHPVIMAGAESPSAIAEAKRLPAIDMTRLDRPVASWSMVRLGPNAVERWHVFANARMVMQDKGAAMLHTTSSRNVTCRY